MIQSNPWPLVDLLDSGNRKKKTIYRWLAVPLLEYVDLLWKISSHVSPISGAAPRRSWVTTHTCGPLESSHPSRPTFSVEEFKGHQWYPAGDTQEPDCQNAHHVCAILGSNHTKECFTMFHPGNPGKFATSNATEPATQMCGKRYKPQRRSNQHLFWPMDVNNKYIQG